MVLRELATSRPLLDEEAQSRRAADRRREPYWGREEETDVRERLAAAARSEPEVVTHCEEATPVPRPLSEPTRNPSPERVDRVADAPSITQKESEHEH